MSVVQRFTGVKFQDQIKDLNFKHLEKTLNQSVGTA